MNEQSTPTQGLDAVTERVSEMVERVAKAIYDLDPFYEAGEYVDGFPVSPGGNLSWEQALTRDAEFEGVSGMLPVTKFSFDTARAAIAALREPSGEMIDALRVQWPGGTGSEATRWRCMIDAALEVSGSRSPSESSDDEDLR